MCNILCLLHFVFSVASFVCLVHQLNCFKYILYFFAPEQCVDVFLSDNVKGDNFNMQPAWMCQKLQILE